MMDLGRYIDRCAVSALLDNDQERIQQLLAAAKLMLGERCYECDGTNVECIGDDHECQDCGDIFRPGEVAVRKLQDLGYNVEYAE